MPTYTIRVPDEHDPPAGSLAFLEAIEAGTSQHTLEHRYALLGTSGEIEITRHSRLGVTIERTA
jgi:hypothetical protein